MLHIASYDQSYRFPSWPWNFLKKNIYISRYIHFCVLLDIRRSMSGKNDFALKWHYMYYKGGFELSE